MTPRFETAGQQNVLKTHYERIGPEPVAYLDETYHVENDGRTRFYVMAAVVILHQDRDPLRDAIDDLVPDGWWHTTEELRTEAGRERALALLQTFQVPDETCVIVDQVSVETSDEDGSMARKAVLGRLLTAVHTGEAGNHPPAPLAVLEELREAKANSFDRSIRNDLIKAQAIAATSNFVAVSPGSEHLLWLPDLVCSAYRQRKLTRNGTLFAEIEDLAHVIQLP